MNKIEFEKLEKFMLAHMRDSAHDKEHAYRVLYLALDIAKHETKVDYDVLVAAAILHDIGRKAQFKNPNLCHGKIGGAMAKKFLKNLGWSEDKADRVERAIVAHRYRKDNPPVNTEEKIIFDADKLDVAGAMGIARTMFFNGALKEPLYTRNPGGEICEDGSDGHNTFLGEYRFKLEKVYDRFYTERGYSLGQERRQAAVDFYNSLVYEINSAESAKKLLEDHIR